MRTPVRTAVEHPGIRRAPGHEIVRDPEASDTPWCRRVGNAKVANDLGTAGE
jgi:hypothetical protein